MVQQAVSLTHAVSREAVPPPTGTVTFLHSDIEDSTALSVRFPVAMRQAVQEHNSLLESIFLRHNGYVFNRMGDGYFVSFSRPSEAAAAAIEVQRELLKHEWPEVGRLRVRIGLNTGAVELHQGDYSGAVVSFTERVCKAGHGGQILLSLATVELLRDNMPDQVTLEPKGEYLLKGFLRPEPLFQMLHPDLPSEFPPLVAPSSVRDNLPVSLTSFIGREREVQEIVSRLLPMMSEPGRRNLRAGEAARPHPKASNRMLTLMGPGGAGKTRLALEAARELRGYYPDGVWYVELDALTEEILLVQAAARALGIQEGPRQTLLENLMDWLREKCLLLVLDNCEHLISAAAELVSQVLVNCPYVSVLATSRTNLRVSGEKRRQVAPLELPNSDNEVSPEEAMQSEAIRLFIERARESRHDFELTRENTGSIVEICRRLDGIPFALELAAARIRAMSPRQILQRLDNTALSNLVRTSRGRHQTLATMMDWSYDLLTEAERRVLRSVSVFSGGWTLEAAEAVCGEDDFLELHFGLIDHSLITSEEQKRGMRLRVLDTIRSYARRHLKDSGAEAELTHRHLLFYRTLAEEAETALRSREQAAALQSLEAELDNIRAALGLETHTEERLRLAGAMARFWTMRGYFSEGCRWLETILNQNADSSLVVRAKALNGLGVLRYRQGEYAPALIYLQESLQLRTELNDSSGRGEVLNNIGHVHREQGKTKEALACFEESLLLHRKAKDLWGEAAVLNSIGMLAAHYLMDYERALDCYQSSLAIYRRLQDRDKSVIILNNMATVMMAQHRYQEAHTQYVDALRLFRELGNRSAMAITLYNLGESMCGEGRFKEAERYFRESLTMRLEVGDQAGLYYPLLGLARIAVQDNQDEDGAHLLGEAESVLEANGLSLPPEETKDFESLRQKLEQALGSGFQKAWEKGKRECSLTHG